MSPITHRRRLRQYTYIRLSFLHQRITTYRGLLLTNISVLNALLPNPSNPLPHPQSTTPLGTVTQEQVHGAAHMAADSMMPTPPVGALIVEQLSGLRNRHPDLDDDVMKVRGGSRGMERQSR